MEDNYIGLGKKSAQNLAEQDNYLFHLIRIDDRKFFPYPTEGQLPPALGWWLAAHVKDMAAIG